MLLDLNALTVQEKTWKNPSLKNWQDEYKQLVVASKNADDPCQPEWMHRKVEENLQN